MTKFRKQKLEANLELIVQKYQIDDKLNMFIPIDII